MPGAYDWISLVFVSLPGMYVCTASADPLMFVRVDRMGLPASTGAHCHIASSSGLRIYGVQCCVELLHPHSQLRIPTTPKYTPTIPRRSCGELLPISSKHG